jgi:transcriptional regulator with XRE-family HTH domain
MKFGDRLTRLRKSKNLTQQEVARRLNISRSAYAGYEIGRRVPEYSTLENMANLFDVPIDYLVGRSESKQLPPMDATLDELVELSDDDILKLPLSFEGMKLTEDEKREFIAIARGIFSARKALKEKR